MSKSAMYAHRDAPDCYTLRQERYRARLQAGNEHPHDVCAIGRTPEELRSMSAQWWPDADFSALDSLVTS